MQSSWLLANAQVSLMLCLAQTAEAGRCIHQVLQARKRWALTLPPTLIAALRAYQLEISPCMARRGVHPCPDVGSHSA